MKRILITGANKGIGLATVKNLLESYQSFTSADVVPDAPYRVMGSSGPRPCPIALFGSVRMTVCPTTHIVGIVVAITFLAG